MSSGALVNVPMLKKFLAQIITFNNKMGLKGVNKRKVVPCIWGPPGIGKTSIVKQLPETNEEIEVIDIPLAQFEEMGDLHGLPRKVAKDGIEVTEYAPPAWVPRDKGDNKTYIVLFDDWNRADIRIIKGCMQLLQNYGTVSWQFPPKTTIILTGNPDDGENLVTGVDTAIITRIRHVELEPDHIAWAEWANEQGDVDERVINFVLRYKEMFCPKKANSKTNPRTLSEFGEFLKNSNLDEDSIRLHARASLDDATAVAFDKFINGEIKFLIDPKKILEGDWEQAEVKKLADERRTDIINTIMDRLYVEINSTNRTAKKKKEFVKFVSQESIPKDMVATLVQRIANSDKKQDWIKDEILAEICINVY